MKIILHQSQNPGIAVAKLVGGLNGRSAIELGDWLLSHVVAKKICIAMNFERVERIDGLGVSALEHVVNRGVDIRLFNVCVEIRAVLKLAKKEDILNIIYNETDENRATLLLKNEITEAEKE